MFPSGAATYSLSRKTALTLRGGFPKTAACPCFPCISRSKISSPTSPKTSTRCRNAARKISTLLSKNTKNSGGLLADERGAAVSAGCFYKLIGDILTKFDCEKRIANERVQPAVDYIAENCTKELSVGELAGLCYLSEPRFFALFKAATGLAPIAYKNTARLKKAANYLISRPDKSVEAVAEALNYSSPAYFIREFRKAFGATPAVYRKTAVEAKL